MDRDVRRAQRAPRRDPRSRAVRRSGSEHGVESQRWNDFRERRHDDESRRSVFRSASSASARLRVESTRGGGGLPRAPRSSLDDMRKLEEFRDAIASAAGPEGLDFDAALELMRQMEALSKMMRDPGMEGDFESALPWISCRELLGDDAAAVHHDSPRSRELARARRATCARAKAGVELTPRAIRRLGELALDRTSTPSSSAAVPAHTTSHHKGIGDAGTRAHPSPQLRRAGAPGRHRHLAKRSEASRAAGLRPSPCPLELAVPTTSRSSTPTSSPRPPRCCCST